MYPPRSISRAGWKKFGLFIIIQALMLVLVSCTNNSAPTMLVSPIKPVPPASEFTLPAEGTLLPPGTSYNQTLDLPAGSSGALFINKTETPVKVAVGGTIADIPKGQIYLFILDPGEYEFYIYGLTDVPISRVERLEFEKVRYLYLMPFGSKSPMVD